MITGELLARTISSLAPTACALLSFFLIEMLGDGRTLTQRDSPGATSFFKRDLLHI